MQEFVAAVPEQQAPLDNGNGAADETFFSTAAPADPTAEAIVSKPQSHLIFGLDGKQQCAQH